MPKTKGRAGVAPAENATAALVAPSVATTAALAFERPCGQEEAPPAKSKKP